ncbi:hypothetical protein PBI_LESEDI_59 [Mycobacterium phage Lesedi]|uniref:Uncharacterized protein n=1 Tax=Mycobacterium phage Lesedi TaxID=2922211 RepID=G1D3K5_9CAUD|nr:hypothetical protein WHEELER_65 [Mycobacterium phage Wheeler]YP_009636881.1 hypothetical protein FGG26_gp59 [Mycobacterium phage Lesedi]AVI03600.1 hypothetical protein SEA_BEESKNEES_65 [Mycobacterium phage BeesKnees]AXC33649.1 hypothetical protein SEA_MICHLEY_66 [Mycobacterium phage Michley]AXC33706.1 hypothetical protein SEA_MRYOLO_60 [Mycobacterium phage Mryolo]AXQ61903.1 hypothetical protein SEA_PHERRISBUELLER_62 [Mycobacterium phage PherrisBueller]QAY03114.1 hypothetical protein SEA_FE
MELLRTWAMVVSMIMLMIINGRLSHIIELLQR